MHETTDMKALHALAEEIRGACRRLRDLSASFPGDRLPEDAALASFREFRRRLFLRLRDLLDRQAEVIGGLGDIPDGCLAPVLSAEMAALREVLDAEAVLRSRMREMGEALRSEMGRLRRGRRGLNGYRRAPSPAARFFEDAV